MKGRTDTPQDRFCLVGIFFFILGLGTLLPWNFFMTASLYFQSRLNNTELTNGTAVRKEYHFNNWMTFLSQLPLLVFTLLNSFMYQRISEAIRIAGSLVFILLLFILTAVLVKVGMHQDLFFSVTMAIIWFINSFGAVLQGSLFGLVGLLPQNYSAVFMSGQGLAGTFAAIAMLLATATSSDKLHELLRFWVGWEVPCQELKLEVVLSTGPNHMPTSSTCSERLQLPSHYTTYQALSADMNVCLKSVETGFGLI